MPGTIGVNLRVTGHCQQGGRKYMEDFFSVAYQQTEDERDLEYAFFGIYDGHGGAEAAAFAKNHLMETIVKHKSFWSDDDEDVLRAIKDGYIATHYAMWKEQEKWPKTASGLPSTAGTTASVAFIRRGKIYVGHVGDSAIVLGYEEPGSSQWQARQLTRDHKPENVDEKARILQCGGKVVAKSGVPRVVWNRPKMGHQGPVRRSTPIDEIPFLAVARSLGDLWSYNSQLNEFVVSPDPDCFVLDIDSSQFRCMVLGTDGLYNMLHAQEVVSIVQSTEEHNSRRAVDVAANDGAASGDSARSSPTAPSDWRNPSKVLVESALERWRTSKMRADNTSAVTLMLDPPGYVRGSSARDPQPAVQRLNKRTTVAAEEAGALVAPLVPSILQPLKEHNNDADGVVAAAAQTNVLRQRLENMVASHCANRLDKENSTVTNRNSISNALKECRQPLDDDETIRKETTEKRDKKRESMCYGAEKKLSKELDASIQINEISSSSGLADLRPNLRKRAAAPPDVSGDGSLGALASGKRERIDTALGPGTSGTFVVARSSNRQRVGDEETTAVPVLCTNKFGKGITLHRRTILRRRSAIVARICRGRVGAAELKGIRVAVVGAHKFHMHRRSGRCHPTQ